MIICDYRVISPQQKEVKNNVKGNDDKTTGRIAGKVENILPEKRVYSQSISYTNPLGMD